MATTGSSPRRWPGAAERLGDRNLALTAFDICLCVHRLEGEGVEAVVSAALRNELLVRALFDHLAVLEDDNARCMDCTAPISSGQSGPTFQVSDAGIDFSAAGCSDQSAVGQ